MQSRKQVLEKWEAALLQGGVDSPRLSAQVLLSHVLGLPRLEMLIDVASPVDESCRIRMDALCARRLRGEPVAYLVGSKEFYGYSFRVGPGVLIPRPETELLLDMMTEMFHSDASLRVLDLGTGSGALAVSCANLFPFARIVAVDVSRQALAIARSNALAHGVLGRTAFFQGDLTDAVKTRAFDVVLANLPYVPLRTRSSLSREVIDYEPELALFSGPDGLDCYRSLAQRLAGRMKPGSVLMCEIDGSQGDAMVELFSERAGGVRVCKDYAGHDRLVIVVF